jgi:hypothetical protein
MNGAIMSSQLVEAGVAAESRGIEARRPRWPMLAALGWMGVTVLGMFCLWRYANTPGEAAGAPDYWPQDALIQLVPNQPTLVVFAHPHCPCTRASLSQLARLMAKCRGKVTPTIVFYKPNDAAEGWEQTDLWRTAAAIPGANVVCDSDGAEAIRFGATTSGQTLLYDVHGKLLFRGGITAARGHEGDNEGQNAIEDLVNDVASWCHETAVFGCPIITSPKSP